MKHLSALFILIVTFASQVSTAAALEGEFNYNESVQGQWRYIGHYYEGVFQNPLNPNLVLTFEFTADGTSRLHWYRLNEPGFCERTGIYSFDGHKIMDKVTWVNPENSFECGKDPDMQLGHNTETPARIVEGKLQTDLPLGDSFLIYVWEKIKQ